MSDLMRVDKVLSNMGYGTRTTIKKVMKKGIVELNGEVIKKPGTLMNPEIDTLTYLGDEVIYKKYIYLVMNKPKDLVCATQDNVHTTVIDVLDDEDKIFSPFPVGRLDIDTEGLLFITNDGKLSYNITSPNKKVSKTYYVELADEGNEDDYQKKFTKGVYLEEEDYTTLPAIVKISAEDSRKAYITIQEGKFHQVKRMFADVGNEVTFLKRVDIGGFKLPDDLETGKYRELTDEEVDYLYNLK